jgi:DNA-binding NarL/FixJ family response regulator
MRVLLVDDHTLFRQGLRTLLEKQGTFQIVGEAEDGRQGSKLVEELHPDVVVMDIAMKGLNGIEATRQIRQKFPRTQVVVLSMHLLESYVRQALEAGAAGYLLKSAAGS